MTENESSFLYHEPCPVCGSSDGLARYDDGHGHCFVCKHYEPAEDDEGRTERAAPEPRTNHDLIKGDIQAIPQRGLTEETCKRYGYAVGVFRGGKCHLAPYYSRTGRLIAQKVRYKKEGKKGFSFIGDAKEKHLFGSKLLRGDGKRVYVTEGEIDAMSVSQALGNKWPVVSVPNGAHGAAKDLKAWVADLERFESVVLCFDMDDPGREAVEECCKLFTPGKILIVTLPEGYKDANDMVRANASAQLVEALWAAQPFRPDGIRSVADLRQKAMTPMTWGRPTPWLGYTKATYGFRPGLYSWGAGVGSGKSTTMKEIMLCNMRPDLLPDHSELRDFNDNPIAIPEPRKVGLFLFEEVPFKTLRDLAGMSLGLRLNKPDVQVDDADIEAAIDTFEGLFFPFDTFGAKDWSEVRAQIIYLIQAEGVLDIWIDPLTALVAQAEDERRELDAVMADLSGIATTYGATIHLVSHLTTPQGTAHEEGGRVLEKHFTGSRAIARWSHNMIGLERDKQGDSPTLLRGLKDREYGEAVGPLVALHFHPTTGRMIEVDMSLLETKDDKKKDHGFRDETGNDDI